MKRWLAACALGGCGVAVVVGLAWLAATSASIAAPPRSYRVTGTDRAAAPVDPEEAPASPPASPAALPTELRSFASRAELDAFLERAAAVRREPRREEILALRSQEAGIDEGDIYALRRHDLVVLRQGQLATVRLRGGTVSPLARVPLSPDGWEDEVWYDELLVHGDRAIVLGYRYGTEHSEILLLDIDRQGRPRLSGRHFLRSDDYFDDGNYATRLLGDDLVLYIPHPLLQGEGDSVAPSLPAIAETLEEDGWTELVDPEDIVQPVGTVGRDPTLHMIVRCDLAAPELRCRGRGVVADGGDATFYVSESAVYVALSPLLFRIPFDGTAISAVAIHGDPIDQLSFHEANDQIGVLLWGQDEEDASPTLVTLPLTAFVPGRLAALRAVWTERLPAPAGYDFENRWVGQSLLYGATDDDDEHAGQLLVHTGHGRTTGIALPHAIERIDALDDGSAIVVGSGSGSALHLTAVALTGEPRLLDRHVEPGAAQAEQRTHAFVFDPASGLLGLPIIAPAYDAEGADMRFDGAAAVLFLRFAGGRLTLAGRLASRGGPAPPDCESSCYDWYGNARPIFTGGRVLALMGDEIVEGRMTAGRLGELRRARLPGFVRACTPDASAYLMCGARPGADRFGDGVECHLDACGGTLRIEGDDAAWLEDDTFARMATRLVRTSPSSFRVEGAPLVPGRRYALVLDPGRIDAGAERVLEMANLSTVGGSPRFCFDPAETTSSRGLFADGCDE